MERALLDIVCCPLTQAPLERMSPPALARLNDAITAGPVKNQAGDAIDAPLEDALITSDGKLAYPIRDGIPILLVEQAIRFDPGG